MRVIIISNNNSKKYKKNMYTLGKNCQPVKNPVAQQSVKAVLTSKSK